MRRARTGSELRFRPVQDRRQADPLNTFNICIGHQPAPEPLHGHVDLMIAPCALPGMPRVVIARDDEWGEHGHAMSEYSQLLWLLEHFDEVARGCEFVRVFTYRRFCSRVAGPGVRAVNHPWSTAISVGQVAAYAGEFERHADAELFNTPHEFAGGMLFQYGDSHVLRDIMEFAEWLVEADVLPAAEVARFLARRPLIPSCNIGTFRPATYRALYSVLRRAADFRTTSRFVPRTGRQRRNMGFLLERLHSHLVLARIESGASEANHGRNMVISDTPVISITD